MIFLRKILIIVLIFILFSCQGQKDEFKCNEDFNVILEEYDYDNINNEWLKEDIAFYIELREICEKSPENIEKLISVNHKKGVAMGNEYSVKSGSHGIGYLSVYYDFIYMRDSLISYKLDIPLKAILLLEKNKLTPQQIFIKSDGFFSNSNDYSFYYGFENASKPYGRIKQKKNMNSKMKFYMTPFSGIKYGCRGGYGNSILPNRCAFKQLEYEQTLTSKDLIYVMHSINLASRLTAIEYYTKNIDQFNKDEQEEIENQITLIFSEFGNEKVEILLGDIGYYLTIEDAVNENLKNDCL